MKSWFNFTLETPVWVSNIPHIETLRTTLFGYTGHEKGSA